MIPPVAGLFSRAIKAPNMEGRAVQDMANEATELRKVLADQLINVGARRHHQEEGQRNTKDYTAAVARGCASAHICRANGHQ